MDFDQWDLYFVEGNCGMWLSRSTAGKLICREGSANFRVPEFLDDALTDLISSQAAHGSRIVFSLDHRQPGDAMIEHRGGGHESGILKRHTHWEIGRAHV